MLANNSRISSEKSQKNESLQTAQSSQFRLDQKRRSYVGHHSVTSMSSLQGIENIYDSKLNEQRPEIHKSLAQHQVKNNLKIFASRKDEGFLADLEVARPQNPVFSIANSMEPLAEIGSINQSQQSNLIQSMASLFGSSATPQENISQQKGPNSTADSSLNKIQNPFQKVNASNHSRLGIKQQ